MDVINAEFVSHFILRPKFDCLLVWASGEK